MAVERDWNVIGQQRVDVQHLRALDSAARYDWDAFAGEIFAGGRALVVAGFSTALAPTPIGSPATSVTLLVAGSALLHPLASEAGTAFRVPADRAAEVLSPSNPRVFGSFTPGAVNYVGVDLRRSADDSTADLVQFLDADTLQESPENVPLARTLDYVISVSGRDFSTTPNIAPVLLVTTDAGGNVTAVQDARAFAFRLGSGGSVPDPRNAYPWPAGRTEAGDDSDFSAGDKAIGSQKEWADAVMTRLWELGGGERWYSPTADRNVQLVRGGSTFAGGEYFEWSGTNLHWRGLAFVFDNSSAVTNAVADQTSDSPGLTDLASGDCVYVDVDRGTDGATLTALRGAVATLGTPVVPGSRFVIAWRIGSAIYTRDQYFPVGSAFAVATPTSLGAVKLSAAAGAPSAPVVPSLDSSGVAQAQGLSRGALAAGALVIGGNGTDTSVAVSLTGVNTAIQGTATVAEGLTSTGKTSAPAATLTGTTAAPAVLVKGISALSNRPVFEAVDSGGNRRYVLDHNCYPTGRDRAEFREEWMFMADTPVNGTTIPNSGGWFSLFAGSASNVQTGGAVNTGGSATGNVLNSSSLRLSQIGGGAFTKVFTGTAMIPSFSGLDLVGEFEFAPSDASSASQLDWYFGFCNADDFSAGANDGFFIRKLGGESTWKACANNGGSVVAADTTVTCSTGGARFRIEYHAAGTAIGIAQAGPFVQVYVDGLPRNQISLGSAVSNKAIYIGFQAVSSSGNTEFGNFGAVLASWNRRLSLDPL